MVGRPTHWEGLNAVEAELGEIQHIHKDIDLPERIVLAHIVIEPRREQRALPAIRPLNKALHPIPRSCGKHIARISSNGAFSHSLGHKPKFKLTHWPLPATQWTAQSLATKQKPPGTSPAAFALVPARSARAAHGRAIQPPKIPIFRAIPHVSRSHDV